VDLINAIKERAAQRPTGRPLSAVLRERRANLDQLNISELLQKDLGASKGISHRDVELHGLAYHRVLANRLDESIIRNAQQLLNRWRIQGKIDPRYANQWDEILALPKERIADLISQDTQHATDLRQNSPFAGSLTEAERLKYSQQLDNA
jgi:hypothetical protein